MDNQSLLMHVGSEASPTGLIPKNSNNINLYIMLSMMLKHTVHHSLLRMGLHIHRLVRVVNHAPPSTYPPTALAGEPSGLYAP